MKRPAILVGVVVLAFVAWVFAEPAVYYGRPVLEDGDGFRLPTAQIRLYGIDSPEIGQMCIDSEGKSFSCGMRAMEAMETIIAGREVVCKKRDTDRFERAVSVCRIGELDIAAELVRQGWALAYTKFSLEYSPQEDEAKATKRGLWAGKFEMPWAWRETHLGSRFAEE